MNLENLFRADIVGFISALIGCIAWFIKLEGRIKSAEKDIITTKKEVDELIIKHDALDNKILNELAKIRESIVRLETILNMIEHGSNENVNNKKERK